MSGNNNISKPIPASNTSIQNANWYGHIPVLISLAPTSLSSPISPRPIHKMISRLSYLHVALHEEVMQLAAYAPVAAGLSSGVSVEEPPDSPTQSGGDEEGESSGKKNDENDDATAASNTAEDNTQQLNNRQSTYPECWFEDEMNGVPLRWHLFVGVLYDLMKGRAIMQDCTTWNSATTKPRQILPWKIRLHFTSYPIDQLLPLDDGIISQPKADNNANSNGDDDECYSRITSLVGRIFRNSLKQALFLQNGSSKVAMSMTKHSHEKIWDAVLQTKYELYHEVNAELQSGITDAPISTQSDISSSLPQLIPVRLLLNGMPAIQKPVKHEKRSEDTSCKRPTELLEQLSTNRAPPHTTLGDVLAEWLPGHYTVDPSSCCAVSISSSCYFIQGVVPSLESSLLDLWRALSHPDHFLYIIVVTGG